MRSVALLLQTGRVQAESVIPMRECSTAYDGSANEVPLGDRSCSDLPHDCFTHPLLWWLVKKKKQKREIKKLTVEFTLAETLRDTCEISARVQKLTRWNWQKTQLWMELGNEAFGGISPIELIIGGRTFKVRQFLEAKEKGE